jgi:hypothetical protein
MQMMTFCGAAKLRGHGFWAERYCAVKPATKTTDQPPGRFTMFGTSRCIYEGGATLFPPELNQL